ncbi:uncharacterized protein TNCV_16851 [Trichonephila clavipes]|nr:uncharacterized protein TNCV_16851 [Trichonephila clavipes]
MGYRRRISTHVLLLTARHKALRLAWARQHRHLTVDDCWRDMGSSIRLDMTQTFDRYVRILSDHLEPFMSIVHSDGLGEFKQDSATPHTSRIAIEWLLEHSSEFRHPHWTSNSQDMNIFEYISDALQRIVQKRSPPPLTPTDL